MVSTLKNGGHLRCSKEWDQDGGRATLTLAARLPERQMAEVHVRCAILNTFNRLGMPVTAPHA